MTFSIKESLSARNIEPRVQCIIEEAIKWIDKIDMKSTNNQDIDRYLTALPLKVCLE